MVEGLDLNLGQRIIRNDLKSTTHATTKNIDSQSPRQPSIPPIDTTDRYSLFGPQWTERGRPFPSPREPSLASSCWTCPHPLLYSHLDPLPINIPHYRSYLDSLQIPSRCLSQSHSLPRKKTTNLSLPTRGKILQSKRPPAAGRRHTRALLEAAPKPPELHRSTLRNALAPTLV